MRRQGERQRLRAPAQHGSVLLNPDLATMARAVTQNRRLAQAQLADYSFGGQSLLELAACARQDLVRKAHLHSASYRDALPVYSAVQDVPILLTGHQPVLFHAGVWLKNFVMAHVSRQVTGVGIHFLVDNDLVRTHSVRVPTVQDGRVMPSGIAFDTGSSGVPHEESFVRDERQWNSFAQRVADATSYFEPEPLILPLWQHVLAADSTAPSGQQIASGRHRLEADLGLQTLEVPFSQLCETRWFFDFAFHLVQHAERFRTLHNQALLQYRTANRIRSRKHPVPELTTSDLGCELPLWIWSTADPQRRPLFVQRQGTTWRFAAGGKSEPLFSLDSQSPDVFGQYDEVRARCGYKLRPRALMTTLYARLVLGDYFIHGIGGAKYDRLTDLLVERFFGLVPPQFAAVSGTYLLPCAIPSHARSQRRDVLSRLRRARFQPETLLADRLANDTQLQRLVGEKRQWIERGANSTERKQRHQDIERINRRLGNYLQADRLAWQQELVALDRQSRAAAILNSREYAFCLFSRERLVPLLNTELPPSS